MTLSNQPATSHTSVLSTATDALTTSGLIHDMNNLLVIVLGQCMLAQRKLPQDDIAQRHLYQLNLAAKQTANLLKQLNSVHSQNNAPRPKAIDLNQFVQDNIFLLETTFLNNVTVDQDLWPAPLRIKIQPTHLNQIIMNLLINAAQALPEQNGQLSITTGRKRLDRNDPETKLIATGPETNGLFKYLQVRDNGRGIDAASLDQIFIPFFTTKSGGKGLGLPTVRELVSLYNGVISVKSTVNFGSEFTIYFPSN